MPEASESSIEIRLAVPADGPALGAAIKRIDGETEYLGEPGEALPWTGRESDYLRELEEKGAGIYIVALDGEEIVGFLGAFAGWLARNRGVIYIAHIGLRTAYRGRRLGGRLFDAVEAWARERSAHRLELQVAEGNRRALALYHRQGFAIEGTMVDSFRGSGRSYDCHLMGKLLVDFPAPVSSGVPSQTQLPVAAAPAAAFALRPLRAEDWRELRVWETVLLRDTPFLLKTRSCRRSVSKRTSPMPWSTSGVISWRRRSSRTGASASSATPMSRSSRSRAWRIWASSSSACCRPIGDAASDAPSPPGSTPGRASAG